MMWPSSLKRYHYGQWKFGVHYCRIRIPAGLTESHLPFPVYFLVLVEILLVKEEPKHVGLLKLLEVL